jgi:hypothetical protein
MAQIEFPVESTHSHFASAEVKQVKGDLSLAMAHLEKVEQATSASTDPAVNVFADKAQQLAELARSLRRDLDHVG